jgi:hypothetical protein
MRAWEVRNYLLDGKLRAFAALARPEPARRGFFLGVIFQGPDSWQEHDPEKILNQAPCFVFVWLA